MNTTICRYHTLLLSLVLIFVPGLALASGSGSGSGSSSSGSGITTTNYPSGTITMSMSIGGVSASATFAGPSGGINTNPRPSGGGSPSGTSGTPGTPTPQGGGCGGRWQATQGSQVCPGRPDTCYFDTNWTFVPGVCPASDASDLCSNIPGIQTTVPTGMERENGVCTGVTNTTCANGASNPPTCDACSNGATNFPTCTDLCSNISGVQTSVPSGMIASGGICSTPGSNLCPDGSERSDHPGGICPNDSDLCSNINGVQTSIPSGMIENNGMCTAPVCSNGATNPPACTDLCSNINGVQTSIPSGMSAIGGICIASDCPDGYVRGEDGICRILGECTTGLVCNAFDGNLYRQYDEGGLCRLSVIETLCPFWCSGNRCIDGPDGPFVFSWSVAPRLVQKGNTVRVAWFVRNASECIVTGTNGDAWSGTSGTKTSTSIPQQTIYALHCTPLQGSTAGPVDRTVTVNIVPTFHGR